MQMLYSDWLSLCTLSAISALSVLDKFEMFSCISELFKHTYKQMDNQIPEKTKRRAFTVSRIKKLKRKWLARVHNCKCQIDSVRAISLKREVKYYDQK